MHEMALMGDILQLVHEDASNRGLERIKKIELIVGEISNAMPDALHMAFDILRDQNLHIFTDEAELVIHVEKAKALCILCGKEYRPDFKIALCPSCQIPSGKVLAGETFQILSYEGSNTYEGGTKNGRTYE